jgi:hypothetical protein
MFVSFCDDQNDVMSAFKAGSQHTSVSNLSLLIATAFDTLMDSTVQNLPMLINS